ncbi:general substrate transporter [Aureobasidium pullulans]|nr:general substrate transporter [Aureobasidium pullulans]
MGKATVILSSAFLAIGGFLFGYDSGIIGGVISFPQFIEYFNDPNSTVTGGIVSTFQGGAVLGTIINMVIADRLGRKRTIAAGSIVSLIGCVLQAAAVNMAMLMVGRFVAGAAVGMLTSTIPMYAAEISESKYRGALSGALQWFLSWGFFAAQWIGYGCQHVKGPFSWRFPLAFQCIPAVILVSGIWFLQESPRWLCEKDRWEEARAVLQKLHHDGTAETDQRIELEFREIRDVIEADRINNSTSVSTIFTKASWRKRLLLGCGVQAFGPLSGINVINYYGPEIYKILGIDNSTSLMIIGISGSLSIVYCTIGLWALERFLTIINKQPMRTKLNNIPLRLAHKDLHFANILIDPATARITSVLDWEFAGVVPFTRWNPSRAFLWNAQESSTSKDEKIALMERYKRRCSERGYGYLIEDAEFTSKEQENMQTAATYLRVVVEVCPRGEGKESVVGWKETAVKAMAALGA